MFITYRRFKGVFKPTMFLIILLYAIFASSFPISKILLTYSSPLFLASARTLLAGLLLLSYCAISGKKNRAYAIIHSHVCYFVQLVVIGIYINYVSRYWAMNYLTTSKACLLFSFEPILSLFFSYLIFGETATRRQWLGFLIGFLSLVPLLISTSSSTICLGDFLCVSWPELLMLVSVAASSYRWVLMRKLVRDHNYSVSFVNGLGMTFGGFLAFLTSCSIENCFPVSEPLSFFGLITLAIFLSNIVCTSLYTHLLRSYTATFLSLAGFMTPLFGAAYGSLLFHESIGWYYYLSVGLLLISLYLFYKDESRDKLEPDNTLVSS